MKLVLIRHAEAVVLGEAGTTSDYDRMLTEKGHAQSAALAAGFAKLGLVPGLILSSPLTRAWETAEVLCRALTPGREPMHCERLALGERRFKKLTGEVVDFSQEVTFLVGHNPDLSHYACWLLGAEEGAIDFSKAAAGLIAFPGKPMKGMGQLKWLVPPVWFLD